MQLTSANVLNRVKFNAVECARGVRAVERHTAGGGVAVRHPSETSWHFVCKGVSFAARERREGAWNTVAVFRVEGGRGVLALAGEPPASAELARAIRASFESCTKPHEGLVREIVGGDWLVPASPRKRAVSPAGKKPAGKSPAGKPAGKPAVDPGVKPGQIRWMKGRVRSQEERIAAIEAQVAEVLGLLRQLTK